MLSIDTALYLKPKLKQFMVDTHTTKDIHIFVNQQIFNNKYFQNKFINELKINFICPDLQFVICKNEQ